MIKCDDCDKAASWFCGGINPFWHCEDHKFHCCERIEQSTEISTERLKEIVSALNELIQRREADEQ